MVSSDDGMMFIEISSTRYENGNFWSVIVIDPRQSAIKAEAIER
jgi:hypothetical protein